MIDFFDVICVDTPCCGYPYDAAGGRRVFVGYPYNAAGGPGMLGGNPHNAADGPRVLGSYPHDATGGYKVLGRWYSGRQLNGDIVMLCGSLSPHNMICVYKQTGRTLIRSTQKFCV